MFFSIDTLLLGYGSINIWLYVLPRTASDILGFSGCHLAGIYANNSQPFETYVSIYINTDSNHSVISVSVYIKVRCFQEIFASAVDIPIQLEAVWVFAIVYNNNNIVYFTYWQSKCSILSIKGCFEVFIEAFFFSYFLLCKNYL